MQRYFGRGWGLEQLPNFTAIGIKEGAVAVVVGDDHRLHEFIRQELEGSFEGCPVIVEYGGLFPLTTGFQGGSRGGSSGIVQGGARVSSDEPGTCTGVFSGVQNPQKLYAVISSHCSANGISSASVGGQRLGKMFRDGGCGKVLFEGTAYEVPSNVKSSRSIIGLGEPKDIQR
jgi:hypothetical protein